MLLVKDVTRKTWGWEWLENAVQDLKYALRRLLKSPGFTIAAIAHQFFGGDDAGAILPAEGECCGRLVDSAQRRKREMARAQLDGVAHRDRPAGAAGSPSIGISRPCSRAQSMAIG